MADRQAVAADEPDDTIIELVERDAAPTWQIASWPDAVRAVTAALSAEVATETIDRPNRIVRRSGIALWYVAPATWWWQADGERRPPTDALAAGVVEIGSGLREVLVRGREAAALLQRHVPVRLDAAGLAEDGFARTDIHHVPVTVCRTPAGFSLLLPRSFATSLHDLLDETAAQFRAR